MKTGIELIAEEKELHEKAGLSSSAVPQICLPKIMSMFEATYDNELYKKQLAFAGALIAAEIDRLQNS